MSNPLDEAAATPSLDEILNRLPDELSDAELMVLAEHFRAEREKFIAAQQAKEDKPKRKPKPKVEDAA